MSAPRTVNELLTFLFDGQPHLLAAPMQTWLSSSRRFTAFVTAFQTKIRKKLRVMAGAESLLDLRLELETAYLLLQERSLSLVYEPQPISRSRGPDFAVTFTSSTHFMVEVTRLRSSQDSGQEQTFSLKMGERLTDMVCDKLGQLLAGHTNIILVGVDAPDFSEDSLRAAMLNLQQRAERNEPAFVKRYGFYDRPDFFRHYQRLSEVLVRGPHGIAGKPLIGWVNPQAADPLPGKVRTALHRSLDAPNGQGNI